MYDTWLPPKRSSRGPRWVRDLEAIDRVLEEQVDVTEGLVVKVSARLDRRKSGPLSPEQWLRVLLVQQISRYDDEDMGFMMNDSTVCRGFCKLDDRPIPERILRENLRRMDGTLWSELLPVLKVCVGRVWRKRYDERIS